MEDMQEMISEFITDCSENLEEFENNLLDLEKNPEAPSVIDSMFRQIHSIKGASGFLAFSKLESLTHKSENVLDLIRQSKGTVNRALISTFLDVCDAMKSMFSVIQVQGNDGENNYPDLIAKLVEFETAFKSGKSIGDTDCQTREEMFEPSVTTEAVVSCEESNATSDEVQELDPVQIESLKALGLYDESKMKASSNTSQEEATELDSVQIESLKSLGLYKEPETNVLEPTPDSVTNETKTNKPTNKTEENKKEGNKNTIAKVKETIRVDVDTLDHLVNLAGELVLIRNQILELSKANSATAFAGSFTNLDMITGEIQRSLMTTRMQPISVVWSKIPRIVRDLANQLGREIEIQMHGENTELDKTIIEAITDPMTHIIRNCCDHGIEMPEERRAAGKPSKGTIKLSAEHRGNWIYVDVIDDGKGIPRSVLRKKALEKGIHTQEELDQMDDQQTLNIIFHPGFSTKDQASNISGRGVGMDVIRSNILKINGNVELTSVEGKGTHLKMRLPLTLAIIPGVIVQINNQRYAIPQSAVQEVASVRREEVENFDNIEGQKFTRLRGNILPLVYSTSVLGIEQSAEQANSETLNYVVINADGYRYGLVIDKVSDIIEIVVKPLDSDQDFKYYAGATIMGDGKVALILDPSKIAEVSKIDKINSEEENRLNTFGSNSDDLTLAFNLANNKNYLIPLNKTSRIEEIEKSNLDQRDLGTFAKFNGKVIRVINLHNLLGCGGNSEENNDPTISTLYYELNGHGIAVDVGHNQTLIRESYEIEACDNSDFVIGTTLIKDKIYEVLNLEDYLGALLGASASRAQNETHVHTNSDDSENEDINLFDTTNSVISFKLGELLFGIKLNAVSEIINQSEVTSTPGSRPSVQGLLNLRGEIMVSRKLKNILEINDLEDTPKELSKSLIVRYNEKKVCLEIGNVDEILNLSQEKFNSAPSNIPANILTYLKGVYNMGQDMLLLLDEKRIISDLFSESLA